MRRTRLLAILLLTLAGACAPRVMPAGDPVTAPALEKDSLRMADGAVLPLKTWRPEARPRAVILALHGFNDYSNAFDAPAAFLTERGFLVYAYDQRGFGGAPHRGIWPGVRTLTGDLRMAVRLVRARHPDAPLILLGESMGASVIMAAMAEDSPPRADGVILSAPAVWARTVMPGWQRTGLSIAAHTIRAMQFTGSGFGKVPSDNIEMLKKLSRDEKVIKWTRVDSVYGLVNLMDAALAGAPALRGNVLILLGKREDIIPHKAIEAFERRLPQTGCGLRLAQYDTGFHMLLRDLMAERVLTDIAAWAGDSTAPLPSGAERPLTVAVAQADSDAAYAGKEGDGAGAPLAVHCGPSTQATRP